MRLPASHRSLSRTSSQQTRRPRMPWQESYNECRIANWATATSSAPHARMLILAVVHRGPRHGDTQIAYSAQAKGSRFAPIIVFCPIAFLLPRNPVPCTADPGSHTLGSLMLHEMTHIYQISGAALDIQDLTIDTARDIHQAMTSGVDTTLDVNAYSYMSSWSWDIGYVVFSIFPHP